MIIWTELGSTSSTCFQRSNQSESLEEYQFFDQPSPSNTKIQSAGTRASQGARYVESELTNVRVEVGADAHHVRLVTEHLLVLLICVGCDILRVRVGPRSPVD